MSVKTILLICAVVCFVLKALTVNTGRVDTFSLGWAFVVASLLV